MRTKRILIAVLAVAVTAAALYVYLDRDMIRLKTGRQLPIIWTDPYGSDEQPIQLTEGRQTLSEFNMHLTPLYYLPESKEIHLGLWYKKWLYTSENIPSRVVQISIKDKDGNMTEGETIARTTGLLDAYHYRKIEMDTQGLSSLELSITLVERQGQDIIPLETKTITLPIEPAALN